MKTASQVQQSLGPQGSSGDTVPISSEPRRTLFRRRDDFMSTTKCCRAVPVHQGHPDVPAPAEDVMVLSLAEYFAKLIADETLNIIAMCRTSRARHLHKPSSENEGLPNICFCSAFHDVCSEISMCSSLLGRKNACPY